MQDNLKTEYKRGISINMSITIKEAERDLSILLDKEKLCIFAGSGISVDSGLPKWDGFIIKYKEICEEIIKINKEHLESNEIKKFDEIVNDVNDFIDRDIIATATALRDIITNLAKYDVSKRIYNLKMTDLFGNKNFNKYHKAIVDTNYKYIITTNYDDLLYRAAVDSNYIDLQKRFYTQENIREISEAIYKEEPAMIHMHGMFPEIRLEDFIIFTKEEYKLIKDKNPGFRILMNSIFMNYSILFVGYGSSDPHLEDIIEDLNMTLKWHNSEDNFVLPRYYLLILKEKLSPIFDHIKDKNRTKVVPVDEYGDMLTLLERLQKDHPRKK